MIIYARIHQVTDVGDKLAIKALSFEIEGPAA